MDQTPRKNITIDTEKKVDELINVLQQMKKEIADCGSKQELAKRIVKGKDKHHISTFSCSRGLR